MDDVKIPMPVLISHETFPRTVFRLHDAAYDEWVMILVSTAVSNLPCWPAPDCRSGRCGCLSPKRAVSAPYYRTD